jgi:hypothetical protein
MQRGVCIADGNDKVSGLSSGGLMLVKREEVIWLLRGKNLELTSLYMGVSAPTLSIWREAFLSAPQAALRHRLDDDWDDPIKP